MGTHQIHCARLHNGQRLLSQQLLTVKEGRVSRLEHGRATAESVVIPATFLVSPGLVDIQVNGGGGVLFNDNPTVEGVKRMAQAHALRGTTALLPTLITDDLAKVDQAIAAVRACLVQEVPGVVGIHLEGPFLSPKRQGIHQTKFMAQALDVAQLSVLGELGKTLVTLAPEQVGLSDIRALTESGVLVFAGHTDCDDQTFEAAKQAGLCGVTHLFNAMSQIGPRQVGVVGATLLDANLWAGIILDGHHVCDKSFELVRRMNRLERTVLVSDAMPSAGSLLAQFELQGQSIFVRDGRCENAQGVLAGASVTLSDCVRIGIEKFSLTQEQALAAATRQPASLLGIEARKGGLHPGSDADLVVWDARHDVAGVMQDGRWVFLQGELQVHVGEAEA